MKHIAIVLASILGIAVTSAPASAQYYGAEADIISPREAAEVVRAAGLDPISRPMWRPGRYIVHAIDRYGRELRVVVDARLGEVVRAVPAGFNDVGPRGYEPYPQPSAYPPSPPPPAEMDDDEERASPPPSAMPRVIPGPRSAAPAPSRSATVTPPQPAKPATAPMPRSRPSDSMASANPSATPAAPSTEPKKDVRVIDMSKPKPAETPESKTAASETKTPDAKAPETKAPEAKPAAPDVKALEDSSAKPRF